MLHHKEKMNSTEDNFNLYFTYVKLYCYIMEKLGLLTGDLYLLAKALFMPHFMITN